MTIAEKSTELGIDLAQIALDKYGVVKCTRDGAFHCFTIKSGEKSNIYLLDDSDVKVHEGFFRWHDDTLAEGSSLAEVESAFKAFIDAQEFNPVDTTVVDYEDLV
jgi:hypothetical protein